MTNRGGIAEQVLGYLKQNANTHVTASEMEKALGLTRQQVFGSIHNLSRKLNGSITKAGLGVYMYNPSSKPDGERGKLFEQIGVTKSGRVLVEGQDGILYVLSEIE